ncbi:di-heme-cytochrome C peroxidase [Hahella ganghwensis]|uniref:di-heme-cytochrome C peroxidase n=1 Tax=Hahella ganghwensis TaxID=286420 RepID=UPI00037537F4|nr:di-heme-cytochrome C peroxidase [Hahella ganghwensis]
MATMDNRMFVTAVVLSGMTVACALQQQGTEITEGDPVPGAKGNVINLEQGWTDDTQLGFYFTAQGSRILPYNWFLVLEQADSQTLFRDDAHIEKLRYLPSSKLKSWNPDGLPVGFVKNTGSDGKEWMGFTCAACHTAEVSYQGQKIRIDGGPTLGNVQGFNFELVRALSRTYQDEAKFERFAKNILGKHPSKQQKEDLRSELLAQTEELGTRNLINHSAPNQPDYGYGRVDAIGQIFNQVMVHFNDMPNNGHPADAPVSYPFLWGTQQSNVVQWTGFAPNGPFDFGALVRNAGEVLGVYGQIDIPDNKKTFRYQSSFDVQGLGDLEAWVALLESPQWPTEYLPPVDPEMVIRGELLYDQYCASCHQVVSRKDEPNIYTAVLTPISDVGTDPLEWTNMMKCYDAGKYQGRKAMGLIGDPIPARTSGLEPLVNATIGGLIDQPAASLDAIAVDYTTELHSEKEHYEKIKDILSQFKLPASGPTGCGNDFPLSEGTYKARPLGGIWATAPYLHNGSVPSLYELLLPADKRSKTFYLGNRELDVKNVGYVSVPTTTLADGTVIRNFKYDTTLKGNSNSGHEYGAGEMKESHRRELLEYLKTL